MSAPLPAAVTLPTTLTWHRFSTRLRPLLVALVVITFVFAAAVLNAVGLPGVLVLLLAAVVAGGLAAFMWRVKRTQFERIWPDSSLTASPEGLFVKEPFRTVSMRWQDMVQLGRGDVGAGLQLPGDAARVVATVGGAGRPGVDALLGQAVVQVDPAAPAWARATLGQQHARTAPGREAILLGFYEEDWRNGQLGAWVRAHRPDLLG